MESLETILLVWEPTQEDWEVLPVESLTVRPTHEESQNTSSTVTLHRQAFQGTVYDYRTAPAEMNGGVGGGDISTTDALVH